MRRLKFRSASSAASKSSPVTAASLTRAERSVGWHMFYGRGFVVFFRARKPRTGLVCLGILQLRGPPAPSPPGSKCSTAPRGVQMHYSRPCAPAVIYTGGHRALFNETLRPILPSMFKCLNRNLPIPLETCQTSRPVTIPGFLTQTFLSSKAVDIGSAICHSCSFNSAGSTVRSLQLAEEFHLLHCQSLTTKKGSVSTVVSRI